MKNFKILLTFIFLSLTTFGQQYELYDFESSMRAPDANFYQICQEAKTFYELHSTNGEEAGGYSKFNRWETFWKSRIGNHNNPVTGSFDPYLNAYGALLGIDPICTNASGDLSNWQFLGRNENSPYSFPNLGIIVSIATDPNNPNKVYVGSNTGGAWMTLNFQSSQPTWVNITDQTHLPGLGINWIAIDPVNTNIIYLATGMGAGFGGGYGVGILKSNDGGQTWSQKNPSTFNNRMICPKVIIDPSNHNVLYALYSEEVYKSLDGGDNWSSIFQLPNSIGQNPYNPNGPALFLRDLELHPSDNNTLYISTDDAESCVWLGTNTGSM